MQHAGKYDIVGVITFTADKAVIFNTAAACAHSANLDFV